MHLSSTNVGEENEGVPPSSDRQKTGREQMRTRHNLQRQALVAYFLNESLPPKVSTTSQNSATLSGPSVQHMGSWETAHIQTIK